MVLELHTGLTLENLDRLNLQRTYGRLLQIDGCIVDARPYDELLTELRTLRRRSSDSDETVREQTDRMQSRAREMGDESA